MKKTRPKILNQVTSKAYPIPFAMIMSHILTYNKPLLLLLSRLFHLVYFIKCWQMFLELNSKRLYQSSGKEKESRCLVFTSSTKRKIRLFHVLVVQRRQRNVQKSVMHVQSCCFSPPTHVRESKTAFDSGFHAVDSGF